MSTASVAAAVAGMRVVGVIDLKGGAAVHAVRGERERYRPVHSAIGGDDGDAVALARGFRDALGLEEIYVADLDAIGGSEHAAGSDDATGSGDAAGRGDAALGAGAGAHTAVLRALAAEARVMVDAGVSEPARARALLELGAHRVIVGTETLSGPEALDRLLADLPDGALILSVDLRDGRVLSPDPQLAGLPALDAVERLQRAGLREAIVLDLALVGSGAGPDVTLIAELHAAFPELELLAGGGVRDVEDLRALEAAGAAGALVATALHSGVIGPRELAQLR
jgi:phosphoribosylformimino-5-aminoimidazole carboxamide ribotide isomerase